MSTFDSAYDRVKGFFEGEISKYIIPDVERLGQIQCHPYCTVPESLAIFSFLDFLGFLTRPLQEELSLDFPQVLARQERGEAIEENDEKPLTISG